MKLIISFYFLFFTFSLLAQNTLYIPYQFPEKFPQDYNFDFKSEYVNLATRKINGVKQRDIVRFAEISTFGKKNLFTSGKIYLGWREMEDYLNQILQQILPAELKGKKNLHVYLTRGTESNAYAIHDGSLFINIGLLAEVVNEAGLAIIIAHEVAHYIHEDPLNSFIKGLKLYTKKNRNQNLELRLDKAVYNRLQEQAADSLGFLLAENAGYDVYYGVSNFMQFKEAEEIEKTSTSKRRLVNVSSKTSGNKESSVESSIDKLLRTHPELTERILFLKKFLSSPNRKKEKAEYVINKSSFNYLQRIAKKECISLLLNQNEYKECARKAFVYHLLEPDNIDYIYYISESLRRMQYTEKRIYDKGFLTENLISLKKGIGVLHDLSLIIRDSTKMASIKATRLTDTTKTAFETYEQAYNYFARLAEENNITESYLTFALHSIKNDSIRKLWINKYLSCADAQHKQYAELLLSGFLYKYLEKNTRQIILLDDLTFFEDHFYGYHNRQMLAEERSPEFIRLLKRLLTNKFPEKELIILNQLSTENIKQKIKLEEAIIGSSFAKYSESSNDIEDESEYKKKEAVDFFILNPEFWEIFKENKLYAINYMDISAFDDKTKIMKWFNVINPCFWYFIVQRFYLAAITGSARFAHKISYYHFDIANKEAGYYSVQTDYKMTKPHFINSVYFAIKSVEE